MATVNRDYLKGLLETEAGSAFLAAEGEGPPIDNLGVSEERITTAVDVSGVLDQKRGAMKAHASQISETSFFLSMPAEAFAAVWGTEWYIRVGAEVVPPSEDSLLVEGGP